MVWPELGAEEGDALFATEALLGAALDLGLDAPVLDAWGADETGKGGVLLGWLDNMEIGFEEAGWMLVKDDGRTGAELALGRAGVLLR